MNGRMLALAAGYIAAWTVVWWVATGPGRDSAAILTRLEKSPPRDAAPILRELTAVYAGSPRQASADFSTFPGLQPLIAGAAAPVPDCLAFVENSLDALAPDGRLSVTLSLCINDAPTLNEKGSWSGNEPIRPRKDALPALRRLLDRETSQPIAVLLATALAAGGQKPTADAIFESSRNMKRPLASRTAELIVLSERRDGPAELRRALRDSLIPDDAASALVESGVLDRDPAWRLFALEWACNPDHAVAAGGAFTALYDLLPAERDRLWGALNATARGKRVPLMLALMRRTGWPAAYRRWWMGVYEEESKAVPDLESQLAGGDVGTFARWATEEKDTQAAMAIRAVLERLRAAAAAKAMR